ncbi:MAG: hypothetical protein FWD22_05310 [Treponema sp.]|nr:hypothetical protein [Treponema sp.]
MKRLLTGFFIILAVSVITGCRQPIGTIDSSAGPNSGGSNLNFMWVIANRYLYEIEHSFNRVEDLKIFSIEDGVMMHVPPDDPNVIIEIIPNPDADIVMSEEVTEQFYPFSEAGRHIIRVTYKGKTDSYSIEVRGTYDIPRGDNTGGLGGGIIWR